MLSPMLTLVVAALLPQGPTLPSQSTSLAVSYEAGIVAGPSLLISVPEQDQGGTDLNGDGDAFDRVAHTVDLGTGDIVNLMIAGDWLAASDAIGVIEEWEGWSGVDLNGDGDLIDYVYRVHDVETGVTRLLPWAVGHGFFQSLSVDRRRVSFLVSEWDSGGADFNNDGDADDLVAFVHDARSGATANLGLAARATGVADGLVAIAVDEFGQGQDLDGNGALDGLVLAVLRSNALVVENTQVPILLTNFGAKLRVQRGAVLVETEESLFPAGGMDLNADGDLTDPISVIWDVRARRMQNLGLALEPGREAMLTPEAVWVPVSEIFQGQLDLNGDGDALDHVLHRVDLPSYAVANLALATVPGTARASAGRCAFGVVEFQQGVDLNGDQDFNDLVMHVFEPAPGVTFNTTIATLPSSPTAMHADGVAFTAVEFSQAGTDMNADGDSLDSVAQFWVSAAGGTLNLGVAVQWSPASADPRNRLVWIHVSEASQGSTDLNGDGDAVDQRVLFAYNPSSTSGYLANTGLAGAFLGEHHRQAGIAMSEFDQGTTDANGDGDSGDSVAVRVGPLP